MKHPKIAIGQKVRFDPNKGIKIGWNFMEKRIVEGAITYINEPNRWFQVEYGKDPVLRIGFKFDDIGENVEFT